MVHVSPRLQDKIWEWPGVEARCMYLSHLAAQVVHVWGKKFLVYGIAA